MRTEDGILEKSGNWKLLEQSVDSIEERVLVINIFLQFQGTFISEAHMLVDLSIFVSSSQQNNILREFYLERKQKKNCFNTFISPINVISQKEVIGALNVTKRRFIIWCSECFEESVDLMKLSVDISKNLDWCSHLNNINCTLTNIGSSSRIFSISSRSLLIY